MEQVRLGIIGVGNIGTRHLTSILEGNVPAIRVTAVADRKEERIDFVKNLEGVSDEMHYYRDGSELIERDDCDAVLISTPHYDHPVLAMAAFERGKHVLCEKPAGVFTKNVREMNEAAQRSGLVFALMFNQRTDPVYRKMHELVQGGSLGAIKRVNWIITDWYRSQAYYDSGNWRATWAGEGGGVLLNQCPHNLDLIQWICGMPAKVQAFCQEGKWHDIEVEDDVTAYLEYPGGATGVFITTTADLPGTNRFEVTLDKGKLVCEDGKLTLYELEVGEREFCYTTKEGFAKPGFKEIQVETKGDNSQHDGILRNFAAAIQNGEALIARGEEGIRGLSLSNAMHLSSWLEQAVALPVDEELYLRKLEEKRANSVRKERAEIYLDTEGSY